MSTQSSSTEATVLMRGTVNRFFDEKGFGFIRPDDNHPDLFVHFSAIETEDEFKRLAEGQRVEFELDHGEKGPFAKNVRVVEDRDLNQFGTVKFVHATGNYGFVIVDADKQEIFFPTRGVDKALLQPGARVSFQIVSTEKGPKAVNISPEE